MVDQYFNNLFMIFLIILCACFGVVVLLIIVHIYKNAQDPNIAVFKTQILPVVTQILPFCKTQILPVGVCPT
jgi:hypothetical protein